MPGARALFVTFSRTAVAQIRSRAGGVLAGVGEAVEILTFHGFAYRLLCGFGRYVGDGRPSYPSGRSADEAGDLGTERHTDDVRPATAAGAPG